MPKIKLQDLTATITGTSLYGVGYDTIHVETLLATDEPIPANASWYVPNGSTVPPAVLEILKLGKLNMSPQSESTLLNGVDDIKQQAISGNLQGVIDDSSKLLLLSILKKVPLTQLPGTQNTYTLSYDYKLYPLKDISPSSYEFNVILPFDTLTIAQGGRVQITVITPIGAKVDPTATKGLVVNANTELKEEVTTSSQSRRSTVSFAYQNDPEFIVRYHY